MRKTMLAAALVLGATAGAGAQDAVPDFLGTWSGTFDVALMGRSAEASPEAEQATITYEITRQEGRLLWGVVSSDKTSGKRPLVLAFSFNNGTLVGSDTEGFHRVTIISPTRMESCFTDNGSGSIMGTCGILERAQP